MVYTFLMTNSHLLNKEEDLQLHYSSSWVRLRLFLTLVLEIICLLNLQGSAKEKHDRTHRRKLLSLFLLLSNSYALKSILTYSVSSFVYLLSEIQHTW